MEAGYRYGVVFVITLVLLVFQIAAAGDPWARAVAIGLEVAALTVVVATSRERARERRHHAVGVALFGAAVVGLVAVDVLPKEVTFAVGGALALAIPAALSGGLVRLIRTRGVTLQAVGGALTVYLYVGLLFAWLIAFISVVDSDPYFAEGDVGAGDRVYFSFTTLTTTGYGDLSPATSVGHSLAVVEMLTGQLYLVTVIGVLVGDLVGRRRR